jgi:hypothetical protein
VPFKNKIDSVTFLLKRTHRHENCLNIHNVDEVFVLTMEDEFIVFPSGCPDILKTCSFLFTLISVSLSSYQLIASYPRNCVS